MNFHDFFCFIQIFALNLREISRTIIMDVDFNISLAEVVEPMVREKFEYDGITTFQQLYQEKKSSLGLSDTQIQKMLKIDRQTLKPILEGNAKRINFLSMLKLASFLGISVDNLAKIYVPQMESEVISELQNAREGSFIAEYFDVPRLIKMNFFQKDSTAHEMAHKIMSFFKLARLQDYADKEYEAALSRTKRDSNRLMKMFWLKSAETQFKNIPNPNEFNRNKLVEILPRIKPYSRIIDTGLLTVAKALFQCGVTVIFQPRIEGLQIRGATMIINHVPCVVLSDNKKNYPTLWFALLHELYHVLYDFEKIEQNVYHISDNELELWLPNEEKADRFALEFFLSEEKYQFISAYIGSNFKVQQFAQKCFIHPSIIYARYCMDHGNWQFYQKYIPDMKGAIELLNTHPFEKESIMESAVKIKEEVFNI